VPSAAQRRNPGREKVYTGFVRTGVHDLSLRTSSLGRLGGMAECLGADGGTLPVHCHTIPPETGGALSGFSAARVIVQRGGLRGSQCAVRLALATLKPLCTRLTQRRARLSLASNTPAARSTVWGRPCPSGTQRSAACVPEPAFRRELYVFSHRTTAPRLKMFVQRLNRQATSSLVRPGFAASCIRSFSCLPRRAGPQASQASHIYRAQKRTLTTRMRGLSPTTVHGAEVEDSVPSVG
jgi:hypothetical protein